MRSLCTMEYGIATNHLNIIRYIIGIWHRQWTVIGTRKASPCGVASNPSRSQTGAQGTRSRAPAVVVDESAPAPADGGESSTVDRKRGTSTQVRLRRTEEDEQQHSQHQTAVVQLSSSKKFVLLCSLPLFVANLWGHTNLFVDLRIKGSVQAQHATWRLQHISVYGCLVVNFWHVMYGKNGSNPRMLPSVTPLWIRNSFQNPLPSFTSTCLPVKEVILNPKNFP